MRCDRCAREIPVGSLVCPFCAAPQADAPTTAAGGGVAGRESASDVIAASLHVAAGTSGQAETSTRSPQTGSGLSRPDSGQHGRFLPGTTVADRYRVVALLGRGGMGEVYRADDLKLGQQVALKFLPGRMVDSNEQVQKLYDEARMARKVSHPNVCRVFDVGETDGQHYVSMEYVDGEDLASLLRRIGRLPEDKAVEIARQLCAALGAAHDEGVLHRDLKPANIMIDGRGRVRLTDFGLAAVSEVRVGTPLYMAPEQLAGTGVSVKSDIYSLGLVLHELFTGKRVFQAEDLTELSRLHQRPPTTSQASLSRLDPSIDRVIHRCLEMDPARRPGSALAVAAGLPGGDPLAAAVAAGETPSPEMVAEAGGLGRLPLSIAGPLLLFALAGAAAVGVLQSGQSLGGWVPMDLPPAVLDARALKIVADLGYPVDFGDRASGFATDLSYFSWLRKEEARPDRPDLVSQGRTPVVSYWWRGSPSTLVPAGPTSVGAGGNVALSDPPRTTPGMVSLQLDTRGRLTWLDVVPERIAMAPNPAGFAWPQLFAWMGFEIGAFTPVSPRLTPDRFADERVAWEGAFPEDAEAPLRIEAAALAGRPVSLRLFTAHAPLEPPEVSAPQSGAAVMAVLLVGGIIVLLLTAIFGGLYVARRNVRSGRADTRGAHRIGFGVAVSIGAAWLLGEHTYSASDINDFIEMLIFVGAVGGLTWALYLAVEPFMRRHAPEALIGWTRLIDGRFTDPLVGRDILFGCTAGVLVRLVDLVPLALSERVETAGNYAGLPVATVTELFGSVAGNATVYVLLGLGLSFLYGLTFLALGRRAWLTYAAWVVIFAAPGFVSGLTINGIRPSATWLTAICWALGWAVWLFVLFRLGMLVFLVMVTTSLLLSAALPTLNLTAWYAPSIIGGLAIFAAVAAYAFYRAVAWKGGLAEAMGGG
ncbi:MAG TPA: serine/threonine-protein kinase [Vicinamibacterales bacterium]|nr:serine/threonine-protein kinase [Vicinamibacterales bacterium]